MDAMIGLTMPLCSDDTVLFRASSARGDARVLFDMQCRSAAVLHSYAAVLHTVRMFGLASRLHYGCEQYLSKKLHGCPCGRWSGLMHRRPRQKRRSGRLWVCRELVERSLTRDGYWIPNGNTSRAVKVSLLIWYCSPTQMGKSCQLLNLRLFRRTEHETGSERHIRLSVVIDGPRASRS